MTVSTRLRRTLVAATAASMMILGVAPAAHAQATAEDFYAGSSGDGGQGGVGVGVGVLSCLIQVQGDCATGNADASGGDSGDVVVSG